MNYVALLWIEVGQSWLKPWITNRDPPRCYAVRGHIFHLYMYVYMYVCVCVCMYVCMYMYMYMYIYIYIYNT